MHRVLKTERFFKPVINQQHDGRRRWADQNVRAARGQGQPALSARRLRLLTLEDTVEFFNLTLGTKLAPQESRIWWVAAPPMWAGRGASVSREAEFS